VDFASRRSSVQLIPWGYGVDWARGEERTAPMLPRAIRVGPNKGAKKSGESIPQVNMDKSPDKPSHFLPLVWTYPDGAQQRRRDAPRRCAPNPPLQSLLDQPFSQAFKRLFLKKKSEKKSLQG